MYEEDMCSYCTYAFPVYVEVLIVRHWFVAEMAWFEYFTANNVISGLNP